jgi:hypothetical protein
MQSLLPHARSFFDGQESDYLGNDGNPVQSGTMAPFQAQDAGNANTSVMPAGDVAPGGVPAARSVPASNGTDIQEETYEFRISNFAGRVDRD